MKHLTLIFFAIILSSCGDIKEVHYLASSDTEDLNFRVANRKNRISIFERESFPLIKDNFDYNSIGNQKNTSDQIEVAHATPTDLEPSTEEAPEEVADSPSDLLDTESKEVIVEADEDSYPRNKQPASFTFPIGVVNATTALNLHLNKTRTRMSISPEPKENKLQVIAAFDGVVQFQDNKLTISSPSKANDFVLKFDKEEASFNVKEGDQVKIGQPLGHTKKEVVFSLKRHGSLSPLCLNFENKTSLPIEIKYSEEENPEDPCAK